ncbi:alpha/beta hydrolase [Acrocarpospora catenulata]|uniref:alpha/beta hydrolase n=1 Tax=Acrocarpospora catenulata TaxID=2836182 RepID=UPI001BDAD9E1|nr:alpha/beta hydrolase [Acrocarpospora catenulata]
MDATFVLVHSPSVGPATWRAVAEELRARGRRVVVPSLVDIGAGAPPYWPRVVDEVVAAAPAGPIALVAHSNAGLFMPLMVEALRGQIAVCLFVDAALPPRTGSVAAAEPEHLAFLGALADSDGILPRWTDWWPDEAIAQLVPDDVLRREVIAEQPRLPLAYYTQNIPVPAKWDHVRGAYLWFSEPYARAAKEADERGWPVARIPGDHLHQLVAPADIAAWLVNAAL